ncbi:Protein AATF [Eumeta japonica]|uniref:Protein AATF n=1 Tax=Eumeta variegata TaxID=151549 RepID=A0A4C1VA11_EUMVA|nr:Protein AATF [Eumeta japonica]
MKSKNKMNKRNILSDKIADILTVKPKADIEDDHIFSTKPKTVSRADLGSSESEDEAIISDFRKRNVNLLSELSTKYEGQVISRKELEDDSDEEVMSEDSKNVIARTNVSSTKDDSLTDSDRLDSDGETGENDDYNIQQTQNSDDSASDESDDSDDDDDNEGYDISQMDEPVKETFEHIKKQNVSEEVKKGNCVRNQLLLWESLLEMRIHLQRCLNTANQMPMPDYYEKLKSEQDFNVESNNTKRKISHLLDRLLLLQNLLLRSFPDTKNLSTSKLTEENGKELAHESDEEIPSDGEDEEIPSDTDNEENQIDSTQPLTENKIDSFKTNIRKRKHEDYEKEIHQTHKAFKVFRDSTIQKWNEKTRLASAANIKNAPTNTILQQISYILSDRNKLVRRTQLKRTEYDIIGYKKALEKADELDSANKSRKDDDEYIEEIFDDSDYYHQLLRELIECKSSDISDPVQLSRQWIALQQMRSKMKRKVDTKATKGRKIKYVVHNQLVNFMAPEKNTSWTDESKNELYKSLFGKMFEHSNVDLKKFNL